MRHLPFSCVRVASAAVLLAGLSACASRVEVPETLFKDSDQILVDLRTRAIGDVHVNFAPGSAKIGPEQRRQLFELAEAIAQHRRDGAMDDTAVVIVGHTDSGGSERDNLALSLNRATAARDWLVRQGVLPSETVFAAGRGEAEPLTHQEASEAERARNRRVAVAIIPAGELATALQGATHHVASLALPRDDAATSPARTSPARQTAQNAPRQAPAPRRSPRGVRSASELTVASGVERRLTVDAGALDGGARARAATADEPASITAPSLNVAASLRNPVADERSSGLRDVASTAPDGGGDAPTFETAGVLRPPSDDADQASARAAPISRDEGRLSRGAIYANAPARIEETVVALATPSEDPAVRPRLGGAPNAIRTTNAIPRAPVIGDRARVTLPHGVLTDECFEDSNGRTCTRAFFWFDVYGDVIGQVEQGVELVVTEVRLRSRPTLGAEQEPEARDAMNKLLGQKVTAALAQIRPPG